MTTKQRDRVLFHSKEDGSAGYNLRNAELLLNELDLDAKMEINDLLELYNIKQYFDNNLFLSSWDEQTQQGYEDKIKLAEKKITKFFLNLTDENIREYVANLDFHYISAFWELFNFIQIYKRINASTFSTLLDKHPEHIHCILLEFNTVVHFDSEIWSFLIRHHESAELLLTKFEQESTRIDNYVFPKSLSLEDKEDIIIRYIKNEDANLNYIRLIEHSVDSSDLKLTPKTRLLAKKRSEELNNKILDEGEAVKIGVQVVFDKDQQEPIKVNVEEYLTTYSYSVNFLDAHTDSASQFLLFKNLFAFTDQNGLITLYSKMSETDVFERLMMKSKNEYPEGLRFRQKNQIALVQLVSMTHYLVKKNDSLEDLIESFVQASLVSEHQITGLRFQLPSKESSFLEKIRIAAPELEFLLKQFQVFTSEGKIDSELIEIDSAPLKFPNVKSLAQKKYAYAAGEKTKILQHHFFSDQSALHYTELFKNKYSNLYDLLENEEVKLADFANFQQDIINHLIKERHLGLSVNGNIEMKNDVMIYFIGELYRDEVISYWHFSSEAREVLDEMEKGKMIRFANTLLTEPEINYYNYYLNKKGYTNGYNIRNKYLHGSNSGSESKHQLEYFILLKLIILTLLKIKDDLIVYKKSIAIDS